MVHSKRYLAVGSLFTAVLLVLFACGGGGSGGGGGGGGVVAGNLLGTVTDATQMAVSGATVTVYDNTGAVPVVVSTATTDAAGRYSFNITTMGSYNVSAEKAPAFFPAGRPVTLVTSRTTVADLNLSSTRDRASQLVKSTAVDSTAGATVQSGTYIGGADRASVTIAADSLETAPAVPYSGTATVYVSPVDTTRMNSGFADHVVVLPLAFGDPVPVGSVLKVYAAAGVAVVDAGGTALTTDVAAPMTLSMPIPANPASLRINATSPVTLWKYDATVDGWFDAGTATRTADAYDADITEGGLYVAGETAPATVVFGTLQYSDATVAGGVTVIASATDETYRNVTTTAADGTFSVLVEAGMQADLEFVKWGAGVQQTVNETVDLFSEPANRGTIVMANVDSTGDAILRLNDSTSTGFIPSSGHLYDAPAALNIAEIADVVFVASTVDPEFNFEQTLTLDAGGGGYPLVLPLDFTQIKLSSSPAFDPAVTRIRIDGATPVTINVRTVNGHTATITISDATLDAGNVWTVTFSSSFQL